MSAEYAVRRALASTGTDEIIFRAGRDLKAALEVRDRERGPTDKTRVHFGVIDEDDPERGELEWEDVDALEDWYLILEDW